MQCPECNHKTVVVDTRERVASEVYRRRKCPACKTKFTTREYVTDVQKGNKHDDSRH